MGEASCRKHVIIGESVQTHEKSRNFTVKIDDFFWKNYARIKNGFLSSTYEVYRRRLPLIERINEEAEVLILLVVTFDYEYLFWKFRLTRLRSETIYREKNLIQKTQKKEEGRQTKNILLAHKKTE